MKRVLTLLPLTLTLTLSACAVAPLVDLKTIRDPQEYQRDLIECHALADMGVSQTGEMTQSSATSVVGGLILGMNPMTLPSGIMQGIALSEYKKSRLRAICLVHRGYNLLNRDKLMITPQARCMEDDYGGYMLGPLIPQSCRDKYIAEDRAIAEKFGYPDPGSQLNN